MSKSMPTAAPSDGGPVRPRTDHQLRRRLFNLRVAAEYWPRTRSSCSHPSDKSLMARLQLGLRSVTGGEDVLLFHAIQQRRTNRGPFAPDPLPQELIEALQEAAAVKAPGCNASPGRRRERRPRTWWLRQTGSSGPTSTRQELAKWFRHGVTRPAMVPPTTPASRTG
jgi:hypothetical protein